MAFIVAFGPMKRDIFELGDDPVVIGRERKANLSLSDFQVSRRHLEIAPADGGFQVRDLGSRNGFYVNRKHVKAKGNAALNDGDELVLGRTGLRFYNDDPGDLTALSAPEIPEAITNQKVVKGDSERPRSADQDEDSNPALEETDDIAVADPTVGLDSEILQFAKGPKAPEKKRFNELSEDIGEDIREDIREDTNSPSPETKDSNRERGSSRKGSARQEKKASARSKREGGSGRRKKNSSRQAESKGGSSRKKRNSSAKLTTAKRRDSAREAVSAEVHSLKTLLDRSERERAFYHKITIALVTFLMLLVGLLFMKLMGTSDTTEDNPIQTTRKDDNDQSQDKPTTVPVEMPSIGVENAARLNKDDFKSRIYPWLENRCSKCHGKTGRKPFRMDFENFEQTLAMAARYVVPGFPDQSYLLQKPLATEEGGVVHGGGALLNVNSQEFESLRAWINNVREDKPKDDSPENPGMDTKDNKNLNPEARIDVSNKAVSTGERVVLDSGASISKTNSTLLVTWTLVAQPEGSDADIEDDGAQLTGFTPDIAGEYQVQLYVQDGQYSDTESVVVIASGEPTNGSSNSGMNKPDNKPANDPKADEPEGPAKDVVAPIFKAVVGRDMTDDDYKKVVNKSKKRTVRNILGLLEAKIYLLKQQLPLFGLTGGDAPPEIYLKLLGKQLRKAENFNMKDAFVEFAISPYFNKKHSNAKDYAKALFQAFLKRSPKGAERSATVKMYEGKEAKLLGKKGRGSAAAAGILALQPEFVKVFIGNAYKLYKGKEPSQTTLDKYVTRFIDDPDSFDKSCERWLKIN